MRGVGRHSLAPMSEALSAGQTIALIGLNALSGTAWVLLAWRRYGRAGRMGRS